MFSRTSAEGITPEQSIDCVFVCVLQFAEGRVKRREKESKTWAETSNKYKYQHKNKRIAHESSIPSGSQKDSVEWDSLKFVALKSSSGDSSLAGCKHPSYLPYSSQTPTRCPSPAPATLHSF